MNYTKGEWKATTDRLATAEGFSIGVESDTLLIAICDKKNWTDKQQRLANANLIAAAPDMYEALKDLIQNVESLQPEIPHLSLSAELGKEALVKAEGGG